MILPLSLKLAQATLKASSGRLLLTQLQSIHQRSLSTRLYTKKHEWIALKDDKQVGRVGISNHAQEALGDVVYVQNPEVGTNFKQYDEIGAIESVKAASELVAPVSGEVTAVNEKIEETPALVNNDCYGDGWLYEIKLKDSKELNDLMDEDGYKKFLENEEQTP